MKKVDLKKLAQSLEEVRSKDSNFLVSADFNQVDLPVTVPVAKEPNPVLEVKKQIVFENSEDFTKTLGEAQKVCNQIQNYRKMDRINGVLLGNCADEDLVDEIFGSVSEFARIIENKGDEFTYHGVKTIYDDQKDVHYFFLLY